MKIITVEIENQNGYHLLQELEKLNILRIIKENVVENKQNCQTNLKVFLLKRKLKVLISIPKQ